MTQRINEHCPTGVRGGIQELVVHPFDPDTIYVIGSEVETALYKSTDGGATYLELGPYQKWQIIEGLADPFVNRVSVSAAGVVFAATRSGVYRYVSPGPRRRAVRAR